MNDDSVAVAVIIEMIHLATLVHDDIMDEASMRRRKATLAAKWGNQVAVLLGDCLFAHALKLAANLPSAEVSRLVASSSGRVCAGEILQSHRRRRWAVDRADYFKVIEMKTAELFALSCDLGARLSGGTPKRRQRCGVMACRWGLPIRFTMIVWISTERNLRRASLWEPILPAAR